MHFNKTSGIIILKIFRSISEVSVLENILIEKGHLRVHVPANTWEEAIAQAGAVLEEAGSITHDYVDAMIAAVREFGPYIVIMPGFAIAHAAPCPAVKKEDIALVTLEKPLDFGSPNDPVLVVLCVSCINHESHLNALQKVAEALDSEEIFAEMFGAETVDELFDVLHRRK